MRRQFDVIVIGAGGSGLAAALAATEAGGRVLILEKCARPGGTTALSIGSYTAANTHLQEAAGIVDSLAAHAEDAAQFAPAEIEQRNDETLRQFFLSEAANTLAWLETQGVFFVGPNPEPPNRVPRMHNVVPDGGAYVTAMMSAALRGGATLRCNASVTALVRNGERVIGVRATVSKRKREFFANHGVILAAGDYASSSSRIAQHKGERFTQVEGINRHATGDGHLLAEEVGARLINMDVTYGPELRFVPARKPAERSWFPITGPAARLTRRVSGLLPAWLARAMSPRRITWQHPENSLFAEGAILLNQSGCRFVNETASPDREIAVANQTGKHAYLLLDGRLVAKYASWPNFVSTAPDIAYAYVSDYQRLRPDITITGYTLEDVALRRGLDPAQVMHSVQQFNEYVACGGQDSFGRSGDESLLESDPWVLLGPLRAYFTTTEGGASVNQQLQVLDETGQIIPGLYAVGQNGLGGMILWGHGLHIAWALTSGRLAGLAAMQP